MKKNLPNIRSRPLVFLLTIAIAAIAVAQEKTVLFHEDFATLDAWKPYAFPKIPRHSSYTIERSAGLHYLKAESNASASAIVYKNLFNVYDYPKARWRWKVSNVYLKGDAKTRAGDDYPIRVYLMFEYDPDKANAFEKLKYGMARKLYGEYPPHSSLSYVWASKEEPDAVLTSPYTDRAKMVLLQQGAKNVGTWQNEEINIVEDYQKAFGSKPPLRARISIMNDSDNTGESSVSYLEYIEISR